MGMQKGEVQVDWTQLEAAKTCPEVSESWAPGRVKKSALKELGVPNKRWPFHLSPTLQITPVVGMKCTFECSI